MLADGSLAALLQQLRVSLTDPAAFEPDVDDRELNLQDAAKFREEEDLSRGAVLKGIIKPGEGDAMPQEGDLVFLHYTVMTDREEVICSTALEHGGPGWPQPFVLGRGRRMLRGMELAVQEMRANEHAMVNIKAPYAFQHKDSGLSLPRGFRVDAPVTVDVTLVGWYAGRDVKCVGESGDIYLRTLQPGQGWESPRPPFEVSLHIEAYSTVSIGQQAEQQPYFSSKQSQPLSCALGMGQLPAGIEAALQAMQRQQETVVYCPTSHLLHDGTLVPVPAISSAQQAPNATPNYAEVKLQLLDFSQVRDMTGNGSVVKRILRKGTGEFPMDCPLEDSRVKVHYRARTQGAERWAVETNSGDIELQAPLEFETGMGEVPEALDMCVRLMLRGEIAAVTSTWQYVHNGRSSLLQGLKPEANVEFEVELLEFDREQSQHVLTGKDKLDRAATLKNQGNMLFQQDQTKLARLKYRKALKLVGNVMDLESDDELATAAKLKSACLLNLARCAERELEWGEALSWCNKAISEDATYAKAYFRRAVVSACLGDYDSARDDFAVCKELDESTAEECDRELRRMDRQAAAADAKQRGALKGFLNR